MTFRMCATPHCPNQAATGLRLCLDCDAEEYAIREAVRLGIDLNETDPVMPCGHRQSAVYRDPEPLGGTSHCTKCAAIVYKNVY